MTAGLLAGGASTARAESLLSPGNTFAVGSSQDDSFGGGQDLMSVARAGDRAQSEADADSEASAKANSSNSADVTVTPDKAGLDTRNYIAEVPTAGSPKMAGSPAATADSSPVYPAGDLKSPPAVTFASVTSGSSTWLVSLCLLGIGALTILGNATSIEAREKVRRRGRVVASSCWGWYSGS